MVMSSGVHPKEIRSRSHHIATLDLQTNFGDLAPTSKCNIIYNFSSVFSLCDFTFTCSCQVSMIFLPLIFAYLFAPIFTID
jgi:hypothetical protein